MKKIIILCVTLLLFSSSCTYTTQGLMINEQRNAVISIDDFFGDSSKTIVYLDQNWDRFDSLWFYNTTQGSNLIPYSIFLNLEQPDNTDLFRSAENMRKLRFLIQKPSFDNPDGLPVGFVKDTFQSKAFMGFTCAACHTNQINYEGVGIRIDGAPALSDIESLMINMTAAIEATLADSKKLSRLTTAVIDSGDTHNKRTFKGELEEILTARQRYDRRNAPVHPAKNNINVAYGYGRLDAFGRIYNRILGHLVKPDIDNFNPANAPVSYPSLWDTPYSDFVQWNGVGDNKPEGRLGFLGPLSRNTGEVLGVFATFDLKKKAEKGYISSAVTRNLTRLESQLRDLESPLWPEHILPKIDRKLAANGRKVFLQYQCDACHMDPQTFDRTDTNRFMKSEHTSLRLIGTDPTMAMNALQRQGQTGYFDSLDIFPAQTMPVLPLLQYAVKQVIAEPDHDKWFTRRWSEQAADFLFAKSDNPIKGHTQRYVDFEIIPDNASREVKAMSLRVYRGRSLNGIWATAPYLHNGSVPNLYELFLPSCSTSEIANGKKCRSNQFTVGGREFDPVKVGFISKNQEEYPGIYEFDTALPSNSNAGHEYAAGKTGIVKRNRQGKALRNEDGSLQLEPRLPAMDDTQRIALVEYLKTL